MHDGCGHNHRAYLWQYGHPDGSVVFDFAMGRGQGEPKEFLFKSDTLGPPIGVTSSHTTATVHGGS